MLLSVAQEGPRLASSNKWFNGMLARLPLIFLVLATFGGLLVIGLNPPLRGPDEPAHFLRALGIAQGELVPRTVDARGRRGLYLARDFYEGFALFNAVRETEPGRSIYMDAFSRYFAQAVVEPSSGSTVFAPYEGAESYSPVPYLAYVPAALLSRALGFKFVGTLYAMRLAGLLATAALVAYAIAIAPSLKWMFFATAMLPTAIYQRSVVSADGAALSLALLVIALCLRSVEQRGGATQRMGWIAACALTKPPQIAFGLLELMRDAPTSMIKWMQAAAVVLPALCLSAAWIVLSSGDVGAWRISEGSGLPAHEFDFFWKLSYLLHHPVVFAAMSFTSLDYSAELWRQLIGVFGWLDIHMLPWAYAAISLLLLVCLFDALALPLAARLRVGGIALATTLAYCVAVFAIFFVTLTPTTAERIHGLQGRYFIAIPPLLAIVLSAIINRGAGRLAAAAALASTLLSVAVMSEALWRVHWSA
jgi:uncharacterized membrane protein